MAIVQVYIPQDSWLLVDPNHRILHMFTGSNYKVSLCGIPCARGEYPDSFGTYVPFHGKPTKHCPECERKYKEKE